MCLEDLLRFCVAEMFVLELVGLLICRFGEVGVELVRLEMERVSDEVGAGGGADLGEGLVKSTKRRKMNIYLV